MRGLSLFPVVSLLALSVTTPAAADLTFTFTSGAMFSGTYEQGDTSNSLRACTPNGSDASTILNFQCSPVALSGLGVQSITLNQTVWYYIGSLTDYELDNNINGGNNEGTNTSTPFRITFDTSVTDPFTIGIPVTVNTSADTVVFNPSGVLVTLGTGAPYEVLIAQVRLSSTLDTTPNPPPSFTTPYTYDIGTSGRQTAYWYLSLTYAAPEPATYLLIGSALLGLAFLRKRRRES
jgi:hypothetical protein